MRVCPWGMTHTRYVIDRKRKFGYFTPVVNAAAVLACVAGHPAKFMGE
jgi:hypothetical protein